MEEDHSTKFRAVLVNKPTNDNDIKAPQRE